jgi:hypothetical protein
MSRRIYGAECRDHSGLGRNLEGGGRDVIQILFRKLLEGTRTIDEKILSQNNQYTRLCHY